jgi:predicted DNA-binding transcriptional regulator AlpA
MVDALIRACMRTPEAARYIAISKSRLSQLRMTGEGQPFIKIGPRAVAYRRADLDAWLDSRVRRTTADK